MPHFHSELPKITIVTPSYNQGKFLRAALESVLQQKYPNLEYIVQDGGSTDESVSILESYSHRPEMHWISQSDAGQTAALNTGFRAATGEIVGFLNADDVLAPNTLWEVAGIFLQSPETFWVTGEYCIVDAQMVPADPVTRYFKRIQRDVLHRFPRLFRSVLSINNPIVQPSTFWRREVHQTLGYLREDLDLVMDYEWWWRLYCTYGSPQITPFVWSYFRVHDESKGGQHFARRLRAQKNVAAEYGAGTVFLGMQELMNSLASALYARNIR